MRVKSNFQNQLFGRTTWVECTWWTRPSSLLPFPPFLYKPFLYYFNPFCPRRAFISAQGSGAPPRRRQKGLWRSWTCDGGKHPKSVKTMARRVGRTGHMLLRLKYFPFLLISIEDEEGVVGALYFYICHSSASSAQRSCYIHHHIHPNQWMGQPPFGQWFVICIVYNFVFGVNFIISWRKQRVKIFTIWFGQAWVGNRIIDVFDDLPKYLDINYFVSLVGSCLLCLYHVASKICCWMFITSEPNVIS